MKYLFVLVFILVYLFFDTSLGYTNTSPFYTHFIYLFQHASVIHLLLNSISFIVVCKLLERIMKWRVFIPISFTIGVIASFFAMYELPTIGISSVIYAMIGLYVGTVLFHLKIKIADTRRFLLFIGCIVCSLLISLSKEGSNYLIHLLSLICGLIGYLILELIHSQSNSL